MVNGICLFEMMKELLQIIAVQNHLKYTYLGVSPYVYSECAVHTYLGLTPLDCLLNKHWSEVYHIAKSTVLSVYDNCLYCTVHLRIFSNIYTLKAFVTRLQLKRALFSLYSAAGHGHRASSRPNESVQLGLTHL